MGSRRPSTWQAALDAHSRRCRHRQHEKDIGQAARPLKAALEGRPDLCDVWRESLIKTLGASRFGCSARSGRRGNRRQQRSSTQRRRCQPAAPRPLPEAARAPRVGEKRLLLFVFLLGVVLVALAALGRHTRVVDRLSRHWALRQDLDKVAVRVLDEGEALHAPRVGGLGELAPE